MKKSQIWGGPFNNIHNPSNHQWVMDEPRPWPGPWSSQLLRPPRWPSRPTSLSSTLWVRHCEPHCCELNTASSTTVSSTLLWAEHCEPDCCRHRGFPAQDALLSSPHWHNGKVRTNDNATIFNQFFPFPDCWGPIAGIDIVSRPEKVVVVLVFELTRQPSTVHIVSTWSTHVCNILHNGIYWID